MPSKLKQIIVESEKFYYSLSFDIGEYDNGVWWLQIYDKSRKMVYDEPFASCMYSSNNKLERKKVRKIIIYNILYPKGFIP